MSISGSIAGTANTPTSSRLCQTALHEVSVTNAAVFFKVHVIPSQYVGENDSNLQCGSGTCCLGAITYHEWIRFSVDQSRWKSQVLIGAPQTNFELPWSSE